MQYNITMKYEDAHTKTKVFTDQEIRKKTAKLSSQISPENILQKQTCAIFRGNKKLKREKRSKSTNINKGNIYWMKPKAFSSI